MAWVRMMGAESVEYHRKTVLGREDDHPGRALAYYGSRGETPLEWGGRLAGRLGLGGAVSDGEYTAIFGPEGPTDPAGGWRLASTKTRPGVELVVSAHKSVAVLGVIGRADDMHEILDAETDATLAFLDRWMERQGGRRGRSGTRTATGGLLWARTRHATSRAGDPNPHDHILVANVTEMLDARGGWKALDTAALRDIVHGATMAGRVASAAKAVELGYAISADAGPSGKLDHWQLTGIPKAVIEVFSKRTADIDAEIEKKGVDTPRARGVAARKTRTAKSAEDEGSLSARWTAELQIIGWPARRILRHLDHAAAVEHQPLRALTDTERQALAFALVGPGGRLAEAKAFARTDIIRAAAPHLYGCRPVELDHVVDAVVSHAETIALIGQPGARNRVWVAASVLATEHAVADVGARLAGDHQRAMVSPDAVQQALAAKERTLGRPLSAGQRRAVEAVAMSGAGLDLVVGIAGSGKTTALEVARAAFEADGYRVLGAATSGQAALNLQREAGVDSSTIASLAWRLEHGTLRLDRHTVVLVDEAGMTSDTDLLKLLVAANIAGAKIVAIGDHRQLDAVAPGGGLEALSHRHPDKVHVLDENLRQHHPGERAALSMLRSGSVEVAVDWYRAHDRIHPQPNRDQALDHTVHAWDADRTSGLDTIMMAWRRRDVAALNHRARQRLHAAGALRGPELEAPGGRRYAAGDRIVALAPSGDRRWVTSQRGNVTRVIGDEALAVTFDDGRTSILVGDELSAERLDHAYAVTVHRTQGATVETAHLYAHGGGRELAYVAMSRARICTKVHIVADNPEQAAADLATEWAVDRRQPWTLDVDTPARPGDKPRPDLAGRIDDRLREARIRAERVALAAIAGREPRAAGLQIAERLANTRTHGPDLGRGGLSR